MSLRRIGIAAIVLLAGLSADAIYGCTVCYGDSESAVVLGAQQATFLMVGLTYFLLGGGVAAFVILRRRAVRQNPHVDQGEASQ